MGKNAIFYAKLTLNWPTSRNRLPTRRSRKSSVIQVPCERVSEIKSKYRRSFLKIY